MSGERFTLDANILVYAIDSSAGLRQALAQEVIRRSRRLDCRITLQAVSEFYEVVTRKGHMPASDAAQQAQDWMELFPCLPTTPSAVRAALAAASSRRASYWDALLVATAAEGGCTAILTEDMADGSSLDGVRVINPFGAAALSVGAQELLGTI